LIEFVHRDVRAVGDDGLDRFGGAFEHFLEFVHLAALDAPQDEIFDIYFALRFLQLAACGCRRDADPDAREFFGLYGLDDALHAPVAAAAAIKRDLYLAEWEVEIVIEHNKTLGSLRAFDERGHRTAGFV